ncbi:unnamed protein product [Ilex paraguariensis]|uniref:C2 domain-containing protein n=1 Tax=Ilex paraguariensis TaxID=185542 RepID=A0ABC8TZR1_9AQUA
MGAHQNFSSLNCELRILRAKNIELKSTCHLFVRCYLSAGKKSRVQINSREISSNSDLFWDELFSLDCFGTEDSVNMLMQGKVVFELRRRNTAPLFGRIGRSQLLGKAEIPWKSVSEAPEMEIEKWVTMISKSRSGHEGFKPPAVKIAMKVQLLAVAETVRRKKNCRLTKWDECGCTDSWCNCVDYDIFALGAALEALALLTSLFSPNSASIVPLLSLLPSLRLGTLSLVAHNRWPLSTYQHHNRWSHYGMALIRRVQHSWAMCNHNVFDVTVFFVLKDNASCMEIKMDNDFYGYFPVTRAFRVDSAIVGFCLPRCSKWEL